MIGRTAVLTVCLLVTSVYLGIASKAEPTPIRQPLAQLPLSIGEWRGRLEPEFSREILNVLRVSDYTLRSYYTPGQRGWVSLYVGYHATQRQGASIHSPLNCLPGAGWTPAIQGRVAFDVSDSVGGARRSIEVNRVVIEKGLDRQLVLYWYQSHGRIVASEYWGKVYSVVDAIRYNRSDAALVRVIARIDEPGPSGLEHAEQRATALVRDVFPLLGQFLPS